MEHLYNIIKENILIEDFNNIDQEIITESIKASIIKELAKQLLDQINKEKKSQEGHSYVHIGNKNFKQIFGQAYIQWDKLDDKDIVTIDAQTWDNDKEKTKNEKLIRKCIKHDSHSIVIGRDPETKEFTYVVLTWGDVYYLTSKGYSNRAGDKTSYYSGRKWHDLSQRDKIDLFNNQTLYYIEYDKMFQDVDKIKTERNLSRMGSIDMSPYGLERIAKENKERYQKLLTKKKAQKTNNDQLLDDCKAMIEKITNIQIMVAKDPIKYADIVFKVCQLSKYIYDERRYVPGRTPRQNGYYTGVNGLIPAISRYMDAVKDMSAGHTYRNADDVKKTLEKTLSDCQAKVEEIEELL